MNIKYPLPAASFYDNDRICNIIEFKAVAGILNLFSPSNTTTINGRMIISRIVSSTIGIVGESLQLVVI